MLLATDYPKFCPECGQRRTAEIDETKPDQCLKCGLFWSRVIAPRAQQTQKLLDLPNYELLEVLKLLYPTISGLVTKVAEQTKLSTSYVLRVVQGHRRNKDVDTAFVGAFREALTKHGAGNIV